MKLIKKPMTVKQLLSLTCVNHENVIGDLSAKITRVASLSEVCKFDFDFNVFDGSVLTFCSEKHLSKLPMIRGLTVVFVPKDKELPAHSGLMTLIQAYNPHLMFIRAMNVLFYVSYRCNLLRSIHDRSLINWDAVTLGKYVIIGANGSIGFGGHSYERNEYGEMEKFSHVGGVIIEDYVEIHSNVCIDRGVLDDTIIGEGTKLDNHVHIAHNCIIGKHCNITAGVIVGGSVKVGDYTFIGLNATIKDGITIGNHVNIGMGAVVINDVPDGVTVVSNPARELKRKETYHPTERDYIR